MARGSNPDISPSDAPVVVISTAFSGGNFEELFHGEYSEFFEAEPIIDTIAPNCPTNLKVVVNSTKKTFLFTWYWPISNNSPDKSIQNDVKEFEFFMVSKDGLVSVGKTPIPRYFYKVLDNKIQWAQEEGIKFCVKAIDYHNLVSESSQIVRVFLNKDYGCKKLEISPIYESYQCGETSLTKKFILRKHAQFMKDTFIFSPGSSMAIKEPFKNNTNVLIITVKDLNTGYTTDFEVDVTHQSIRMITTVFGPTTTSSGIADSIRTGGMGLGGGRFVG